MKTQARQLDWEVASRDALLGSGWPRQLDWEVASLDDELGSGWHRQLCWDIVSLDALWVSEPRQLYLGSG
jgi:hypothetical protein